MADIVTEFAQQGRALAAKDRERLVDLLLDSLSDAPDATVEEAWRREVRKRVASYERGDAVLYDTNDVLLEAQRLAP